MINIKTKQNLLAIKLSLYFVISIVLFGFTYYLLGFTENHRVTMDKEVAGFWDSMYFSVVSITTLGYGDYTPEGISKLFASIEAVFGLVFVGYSLSQILSIKQDSFIEYLANDAMFQTYSACIESLTDAKELIGDQRRKVKKKSLPEQISFTLNKGNPFYAAQRSLQKINGYARHIVEIKKADNLEKHIERSAHHIEELISFIKKYLTSLESTDLNWRTRRTKQILNEICSLAEEYCDNYIMFTKYKCDKYKNGNSYNELLKSLISDLRELIDEE